MGSNFAAEGDSWHLGLNLAAILSQWSLRTAGHLSTNLLRRLRPSETVLSDFAFEIEFFEGCDGSFGQTPRLVFSGVGVAIQVSIQEPHGAGVDRKSTNRLTERDMIEV